MSDFADKKHEIRQRLIRARYPRRAQANFAAARDHNPLILEDCPTCHGSGQQCEEAAGVALLEECRDCGGEGITGRVVPAFSDAGGIRQASVREGWVRCPWCHVKFATRDRHRWTGLRHLSCGHKIELVAEAP